MSYNPGGPPASRTCCVLLLVAPLVFRAPSGPAAREIATREPKGSEWSISKPARALRTLRHPPHRRCLCCWCVAWCVVSMPGQALPPPTGAAARPCRRPPAPRPGPLVPPAPHTSVAVGVLRHAKPSDGVSPACRSFGWRHSPVWWLRGCESRGVAAKLQTHWVKNAGNRLFWLNGSALWRNLWVWMHRLRYPALQVTRIRVGSASWAPLLAPVTRSCAAKPYWWHGGQPA